MFSTQGLPAIFVSDNGPQFVSKEFKEYLRRNDIRHCPLPYYHAASNGQVERTVHTAKALLKKIVADKEISQQISNYFHHYTQLLTGGSPAELLMKQQLRECLSLVKPSKTLEIQTTQTD